MAVTQEDREQVSAFVTDFSKGMPCALCEVALSDDDECYSLVDSPIEGEYLVYKLCAGCFDSRSSTEEQECIRATAREKLRKRKLAAML